MKKLPLVVLVLSCVASCALDFDAPKTGEPSRTTAAAVSAEPTAQRATSSDPSSSDSPVNTPEGSCQIDQRSATPQSHETGLCVLETSGTCKVEYSPDCALGRIALSTSWDADCQEVIDTVPCQIPSL